MKKLSVWIWAGIVALACWPVASMVPGRRASAQVITNPQFSYPIMNPTYSFQRLGGPFIYNPGNRPMTIFSGGQFGPGFYDPFTFNPQPQVPQGYYLIPVDPNAAYGGTFANIPPGSTGDQSTTRTTGAYPIARTNDLIEAAYEKSGQLWMQWQGETMAARVVQFALLDSNRSIVKQVNVDELPAEARFDPNPKAAYGQIIVVYVNGTSNATVFPLQKPAPKPEPATAPKPAEKTAEPVKGDGDAPSEKR